MEQRAGVEVLCDRSEESYGEWKKGKAALSKRSGELVKVSLCSALSWNCGQHCLHKDAFKVQNL